MLLLSARFFRMRLIFITAVLLLVTGIDVFGQSGDARFPTPVSASEIVDSIAARDIGDSRVTDYFYTFTGLPGDLLITLESKNLNGDIDVFTAGELRPLMKITFYAESTTSSTKNIYLRKRESLILRVEARTPNDDPGTYRIRFGGSFEPIRAEGLAADSEKPAEANKDSGKTSDRKTSRVSSVGARIDEPVEEAVAAPTPKPTPEAVPEKATPKEPVKDTTTRTVRGRRLPTRRNTTKPPAENEPAKDSAKDSAKESSNEKPAEAATKKPSRTGSPKGTAAPDKNVDADGEKNTESAAAKPAPTRRSASRRAGNRAPNPTKPPSHPEDSGRLLIEQKDGTRREFLMSNVLKVTVENGEIVVVTGDGNTERVSMAQVARMSIVP